MLARTLSEPECPVEAIFFEADLPSEWEEYKAINAEYDYENAKSIPGL